jgi:hypothetical protein
MGMFGPEQIEVAAAIAVPLFVFVINWAMRAHHGYALSAAADFALSLAAFDLIALIYSKVFSKVMRDEVFKESFTRLMVIFFVVTFGTWVTAFLSLEYRMTAGYDFKGKCYVVGRPMGSFITGWTLLVTFLTVHIFAFIYE